MSAATLASLSTLLWVVLTSSLFVILAHWSAGGSWGALPGLVRGVQQWTATDRANGTPNVGSPRSEGGEPTQPAAAEGAEIVEISAGRIEAD